MYGDQSGVFVCGYWVLVLMTGQGDTVIDFVFQESQRAKTVMSDNPGEWILQSG